LARALVGSEGTCVTFLEAEVALVPWPAHRSLLVLGYPDIYQAADDVPFVRGFGPIGLEGMDETLIQHMIRKKLHPQEVKLLPNGRGWLLVEFGAPNREEGDGRARVLMDALKRRGSPPSMKLFDDSAQEAHVWKTREAGLGATAFVPREPDAWEGWEDSAVPPERLGEYLRAFTKVMERHGYRSALYGHFGDGCLHCRINFDLVTAEGVRTYRHFVKEAADLVVKLGGSFSGEHGDGQSRGELLSKMFGPELVRAFAEFKAIWDPDGRMNPGKKINADRLDENLRLGPAYRPWEPSTHFAYSEDEGRFSRAALRCVGVGECRKLEGGTMCPSYRATREEKHSTRGRAHLLFEMLHGNPLERRWHEEGVREALDLCLACKACKSECPLNVDMATYKAEFLSHYYAGRLRPRAAYAMGLIHIWSRFASLAPRLVNAIGQSRSGGSVLKWLGGIAPERSLPLFAPETFRAWFEKRGNPSPAADVVLWPDTFTNHFHPEIGHAAVEVLEDAGVNVALPHGFVCCGRPLYDFGLLGSARRLLERNLRVLKPWLRTSTPVVVLEPSCAAVFRHELTQLLPHDEDAIRLSKLTLTLAEFLEKHRPNYRPPTPPHHSSALVQRHCHHQAVLGFEADQKLFQRMGMEVEVLDSGCCGMAGSFGFEAEKYDVSMKVGEQVLLPRIRAASHKAPILADGFSCRTQIEQSTMRRALHLAQVLQAGVRHQRGADSLPNRQVAPSRRRRRRLAVGAVALGLLAAVTLGARALRRT
jgi:Fe-S oxidoreductase